MSLIWTPQSEASSSGTGDYYIDTSDPLSAGLILAMLPGIPVNLAALPGERLRQGYFRSMTGPAPNGTSLLQNGRMGNGNGNDMTNGKAGLYLGNSKLDQGAPLLGRLAAFTLLVWCTNAGALIGGASGTDADLDDGRLGNGNSVYGERGEADYGNSICKLDFGFINNATVWNFVYRNANSQLNQLQLRVDNHGWPGDPDNMMVASVVNNYGTHIVRAYNPKGTPGNGTNPVDGETSFYFGTNRNFADVYSVVGSDPWDNRAVWNGQIHGVLAWDRPMTLENWNSLKTNPGRFIKQS